jgi:hypothetical protein
VNIPTPRTLYESVLISRMRVLLTHNPTVQIAGDLTSTNPSQHSHNNSNTNAKPTKHNANLERALRSPNKPSSNYATAHQARWQFRTKCPSHPGHRLRLLRRPIRADLRLPLPQPEAAHIRWRSSQSFSSSSDLPHGSGVRVCDAPPPRAFVSDEEVS